MHDWYILPPAALLAHLYRDEACDHSCCMHDPAACGGMTKQRSPHKMLSSLTTRKRWPGGHTREFIQGHSKRG
jgi:hypothetical protein